MTWWGLVEVKGCFPSACAPTCSCVGPPGATNFRVIQFIKVFHHLIESFPLRLLAAAADVLHGYVCTLIPYNSHRFF